MIFYILVSTPLNNLGTSHVTASLGQTTLLYFSFSKLLN